MPFPSFFAKAPRIHLRDGLADFLGAAEDGLMEYGYEDAVRVAGHSCPTVAGSWLMARAALRALYPDGLAERGGVRVTMQAGEDEGTTGVIAQVFTLVTGAAAHNGFHGIGGRFTRHGLLTYGDAGLQAIARVSRIDTGAAVEVSMDLSSIPPVPNLRHLMVQAMADNAPDEVRRAFGAAWQDRVRRLLLEHADDPAVIQVRAAV